LKGVDDCLAISNEVSDRVQNAIQKYTTSITQIAFNYTKNLHDAEDIAQEVFFALLTKNPVIKNDEHEKAWLIRVAINKCKNHLRSSELRLRVPLTDQMGYMPGQPNEPLQILFELDQKYRIPLHLFYYEEYSIKEIAAILGKSPSTITTWLERGRNLIRTSLGVPKNE
jgi:DNA-directed RNA polymerase specialized sigma24 family protein